MEKSGENEQNLNEKIRENQGFFILNIGGNPVWRLEFRLLAE